jgi:queuine/archaeosine tRNA-ribosyltransferase
MLLTWHNLVFYQDLMGALRAAIVRGEAHQLSVELMTKWSVESQV